MEVKRILDYLIMISNKNLFINVGIHLLILIAFAAIYFLKDSKIKGYVFNAALSVLFVSVAVNAIMYGNPFHALTFGIMAIVSLTVLLREKKQLTTPQMGIKTMISVLLILIGLWYPEFVRVNAFESLLMSPTGIVPCPTLITALGMLNLYYPSINKKLFFGTILLGSIYGYIGVFIFGVYFDLWLVGATIYSIIAVISNRAAKQGDKLLKV